MCWRAGPARSWFLTGIILPSKPQVWPILTRSVLMDLPVYCCAARLFGKTKTVFPPRWVRRSTIWLLFVFGNLMQIFAWVAPCNEIKVINNGKVIMQI